MQTALHLRRLEASHAHLRKALDGLEGVQTADDLDLEEIAAALDEIRRAVHAGDIELSPEDRATLFVTFAHLTVRRFRRGE